VNDVMSFRKAIFHKMMQVPNNHNDEW